MGALLATLLFVAWPAAAFADAADYGYPYPTAPDCNEQTGANCIGDQWGFTQGQCMSWVAFRLNQLNADGLGSTFDTTWRQPAGQRWGNGIEWGPAATRAGITVDDTPALGSVAWWTAEGGHVAYVETVNADGSVEISEMNADYHNGFGFATLRRGARWPAGFIHVADRTSPGSATPPGAPTQVVAAGGNARATVTWRAPASNGGSALVGYTVRAQPGGMVATVPGNSTSATVTGLANGVSYRFTVHATNAVGTGPESAPSNAVVPAGPPGAPVAVQAAAGDGHASLTWSAPATDGGRPVASYRVTTQPGGAATTVAAPATTTTIDGLTNGVAYTFTVEATNSVGTGAPSASNAVVPAGVPGPPSGVRAVGRGRSLDVQWVAPARDNGATVTAYDVRVYRRGTLVKTVRTGAVLRATVRGLTASATYVARVSASNRVGESVASAASAPVTLAAPPPPPGYWMLTRDGNVYAFGVPTAGEVRRPAHDAVQIVATGANGYYVVAGDRVHAVGDAPRFDPPALHLARGERVTSLSLFGPRGAGYWLFTSKGRVVAVGPRTTARNAFYGDLRNTRLSARVLGSVATPTGRGYYMVASDGGVFAFGDARFRGSMGGRRLDKPIVALVPTADNRGYWLVASDGGVFAFGSAKYRGSMGGVRLARPVVGMIRYGNGYLMVAADGGVFNFSNRPFVGSLAGRPPSSPIVSIAAPS